MEKWWQVVHAPIYWMNFEVHSGCRYEIRKCSQVEVERSKRSQIKIDFEKLTNLNI